MIDYIYNKIKMLISRAQTSNMQIDGQFGYGISVTRFNASTRAQSYMPYGYYSVPPIGTSTLNMNVMGSEDNQVVFPYHAPKIPFTAGKPGESMMGNILKGTYIKFLEDGTVTIQTANNLIVNGDSTFNGDMSITGNLTVEGDIICNQNITATQDIMGNTISDSTGSINNMRNEYNPHTHEESGGGTTSGPTPQMD